LIGKGNGSLVRKRAYIADAGAASARQIFDRGGGTAAATRGDAQLELEIVERSGAGVHGGADLAFGDGVTYTNVHENNYRELFAFKQPEKAGTP
jgi:hypothetical protein